MTTIDTAVVSPASLPTPPPGAPFSPPLAAAISSPPTAQPAVPSAIPPAAPPAAAPMYAAGPATPQAVPSPSPPMARSAEAPAIPVANPYSPPAAQNAFPISLKWGIGIAVLMVGIYIFYTGRKFLNSPVGQAFGTLLGGAGSFLLALANLPSWLLVGLGLTYLFGPAILKMGGAVVRQLASLAEAGNAKAEVKKSGGASDDEVKAYVDGVATEGVRVIRQQQLAESGGSSAAQERLAQAEQARVAAISEAARSPVTEAADAEGAKDARDIIE